MNWNCGRQWCQAWGGDLATFTSLEEYNLMYSTITGVDYCWIGYNDIDSEGTWVWVDGNSSIYTNWHPDEPNNGRGIQDCGWTWEDQKVDDVHCDILVLCSLCSKIGQFLVI